MADAVHRSNVHAISDFYSVANSYSDTCAYIHPLSDVYTMADAYPSTHFDPITYADLYAVAHLYAVADSDLHPIPDLHAVADGDTDTCSYCHGSTYANTDSGPLDTDADCNPANADTGSDGHCSTDTDPTRGIPAAKGKVPRLEITLDRELWGISDIARGRDS